MTDDDRVTLRELLAAQLKGLEERLGKIEKKVDHIEANVEELKDNQSGMISWRALGFAMTTIITVLTFAWVVTHA